MHFFRFLFDHITMSQIMDLIFLTSTGFSAYWDDKIIIFDKKQNKNFFPFSSEVWKCKFCMISYVLQQLGFLSIIIYHEKSYIYRKEDRMQISKVHKMFSTLLSE